MNARSRILAYKNGSKGARNLSEALGALILHKRGSRFRPRRNDLVIRWGLAPNTERMGDFPTLNSLDSVRLVSDKGRFFRELQGTPAEEYMPRSWTARHEVPADAYPVVCRTVLSGHSGEGIVIANTPEELVPAALFVQYVNKDQEYRVHLGRTPEGEITIIGKQRKARRLSVPDEEVNWKVRNLEGGFIYARNGFETPTSVLEAAERVFDETGLDFGAVDVIYKASTDTALVLEINSAPGLTGSTVGEYAEFFKDHAERKVR